VLLIDGNNYADKFAVGNAVGWSAGVQIQYCLISTTGRINWYAATPAEFASLIGSGGGGGGSALPPATDGIAISSGTAWDAPFYLGSGTAGQMVASNGSGGLTAVVVGTAGQVLTWPVSGYVPLFETSTAQIASFYLAVTGVGSSFLAPVAPSWWNPGNEIVPPGTGGTANVSLPYAVSISVVLNSTSAGNKDCWTVADWSGHQLTINNTTDIDYSGNAVLLITYIGPAKP
jgi:hypothetical protein